MMDLTDNVNITTILVGLAAFLISLIWMRRRPRPGYPPVPRGAWPFLGHLLQLGSDPRKQFARFREECGDIYSLYLGSNHVIVLNGLDVVKEALVKQGDHFTDRAVMYTDIASNSVNKGIASSSGPVWKEQRGFATTVLRNFGLGKNIMAEKIQEEINCFMEVLESYQGQPRDVVEATTVALSNIMCSLIVGQRFEYDDERFKHIIYIMKDNLLKFKGTALLNFFPWLRFLPGDLFYGKVIAKNFLVFFDIFARFYIEENEDVVGEAGNYVAAYLQEMKRKAQAGENTHLDKPNLLRSILDLFVAGTETTSMTLGWFFLYMINYPNVQERIFEEINEVVGQERPPTLQDKTKLTLTTATIMEVQRLASLVPLGIPRLLSQDVSLRGYTLPKGAEIMVNFDTVLHDRTSWGEDADKFRPERFIAPDGILVTPEAWMPFALGKRNCLGEGMAKQELFLFATNIIQRFKVLPADPGSVPPVKGVFRITHVPEPYDVRFVSRRSRL